MPKDDPFDPSKRRETAGEMASRQAAQLTEMSEIGLELARGFAQQVRRPGASLEDVLSAANAVADIAEEMVRSIALAHKLEAEARAKSRTVAAIKATLAPPATKERPTPPSKSLQELAEDIRARRMGRGGKTGLPGLPRPKPPTVH